jgi:hypothetical protein
MGMSGKVDAAYSRKSAANASISYRIAVRFDDPVKRL